MQDYESGFGKVILCNEPLIREVRLYALDQVIIYLDDLI